MTQLHNSNHPSFNQDDYDNNFYYCDKEHPFIAFTTCYCPLCEANEENHKLTDEIFSTANCYEDMQEKYYELYLSVKNSSPELLI